MNAKEAIKRISYLVDGDLRDREYAAPVYVFIREQAARIAELEDKLRWFLTHGGQSNDQHGAQETHTLKASSACNKGEKMNAELTPIEQLTFDFARLVAGYPDAVWSYPRKSLREDPRPSLLGDERPATEEEAASGSGILVREQLPDYPNDWNATIRAIEARGWMWQKIAHPSIIAVYYIGDNGAAPITVDEPPCIALMRAAVMAAKEGKS